MALTRAEKGVKLSFARSRIKWGSHVSNPPSRFIKEIDRQYILNPLTDWEDELRTKFDDEDVLGGKFSSGGRGGYSGGTGMRGNMQGRGGFSGSPQRPGSMQRVSPPAGFVPQRQVEKRDFTQDSPAKVEVGQTIEHDRFGIGVVVSIEGDIASRKAVVDFKEGGRKTLLLKFAKVRVIQR